MCFLNFIVSHKQSEKRIALLCSSCIVVFDTYFSLVQVISWSNRLLWSILLNICLAQGSVVNTLQTSLQEIVVNWKVDVTSPSLSMILETFRTQVSVIPRPVN